MVNFLAVVVGLMILVGLLLIRKPRPEKTLAAWRWMVCAWGLLLLVHLFSPIHYLAYQLSISTVLYCALWVGVFVFGDELGYRSSRSRSFSGSQTTAFAQNAYTYRVPRNLTVLSLVGLVILGISVGVGSVFSKGLDVAALRGAQLVGTNEGIVKTVATFLTSVGLVAFTVDLVYSVLTNSYLHRFSLMGFGAYLCIYILVGGRSGWILGGGSFLVILVASRRFLRQRYKHAKRLIVLLLLVLLVGSSYVALVATTRTQGWTGSMDNKITYLNILNQSFLDEDFRESLRSFGPVGYVIIEVFYYLSPQLYGLGYSLQYYQGNWGWGVIQFPYVARRIEQFLDVYWIQDITTADQALFEQLGLAPNFFRTAVHSTFVDFGPILSLLFVLGCGFLAGRTRSSAIHNPTPVTIALQALICSGAAWTIIYSPFIEPGWAFPLMWFLVLKVIMKHPQPVDQVSDPTLQATRLPLRIDS
jgi:hypothetical protein